MNLNQKVFKLVVVLLFVICATFFSYRAFSVTENEEATTVMLTSVAADWTYTGNSMMYGKYGKGVRMDWIAFCPGTDTGDVVAIKEGSDAGPVIFPANCVNAFDQRIIYYHGARLRPVLDYSDCSLSSGHKIIFQLWPAQ